ncbi:hypothetical protein GXW78_08160 [Roseomonas terrae]|uniref:Uncharacterized protein n=1 Tax=Neoroseomonas terrae TaxID=424799 RepID=A0ABS5EF32_9PROT|nr:hypothetical protein [Neoroseomonas terrae]MBR0649631.1 hypothetical protein [Neoroseomonas terrae]
MAEPLPDRVYHDSPDDERAAASAARPDRDDASAQNALLIDLVRALARQAAADAWGEATQPRTSEPYP